MEMKMPKKEAGYWAGLRKLTAAGDDDVEISKSSVADAAGQSRGPLSTNAKYRELGDAIAQAEADRRERVRRGNDPRWAERQLGKDLQKAVSLCAHYELENTRLVAAAVRAEARGERAKRNQRRADETHPAG